MSSTIHELKVWPQFFGALALGEKTFEIRQDDRGFSVGDVLRLRNWDGEESEYVGGEVFARITYIFRGSDLPQFGVQPGFVVLAIKNLTKKERAVLEPHND